MIPYLQQLARDPSSQVRREVAIALHRNQSPQADELWTRLARQHDGQDRWYLEALGIGAAGQWDRFFGTWLDQIGDDWNSPAGRDIVWRARVGAALPLLAEIIRDPAIDIEEKPRYFRAFHFHDSPDKQQHLISILDGQQRLNLMALKQLDRSALQQSEMLQNQLDQTLSAFSGSQDYLDLVEQFGLETRHQELMNLMHAYPDSSLGIRAARLSVQFGGSELIGAVLDGNDEQEKKTLITVLGNASTPESIDILKEFVLHEQNEMTMRRHAVGSLGSSWGGELQLVELVKGGVLPESLDEPAAEALSDSWRGDVRQLAKELRGESATTQIDLPPIAELVSLTGDPDRGKQVFGQFCQICHQVSGQGTEFGPPLSEIGNKLPKEGLYDAILNPNSGISFGYEGHELTLEDDTQVAGIIRNETETEVELLMPGGYTTTYDRSEVRSRKQMERSLMPENLYAGMSRQELVNLVEYLTSLK